MILFTFLHTLLRSYSGSELFNYLTGVENQTLTKQNRPHEGKEEIYLALMDDYSVIT